MLAIFFMKNPLCRSKSYFSGWNLMKRVQIQLLGEKNCIWVLFCKESIKPNVFTWNSNSPNVKCFYLSSQWFLFYNLTLQSNPRSLPVYVFCNLGFFIHLITHILIFLKYVRFVQIDLASFLHLKPGSTSRLSYFLSSTPSKHTLIEMADLLWVLKFLISSLC
jgi:hypothetical protein